MKVTHIWWSHPWEGPIPSMNPLDHRRICPWEARFLYRMARISLVHRRIRAPYPAPRPRMARFLYRMAQIPLDHRRILGPVPGPGGQNGQKPPKWPFLDPFLSPSERVWPEPLLPPILYGIVGGPSWPDWPGGPKKGSKKGPKWPKSS